MADDTDGILKVMRSYQYYAASRITGRVAMRRGRIKISMAAISGTLLVPVKH